MRDYPSDDPERTRTESWWRERVDSGDTQPANATGLDIDHIMSAWEMGREAGRADARANPAPQEPAPLPPTSADKPPATRETTHLLAVDKETSDPRNPPSKSGPRTPPADVLAAENADLRRQLAALAEQCGPSCAEEIQRLRVRAEAAEARVLELEERLHAYEETDPT